MGGAAARVFLDTSALFAACWSSAGGSRLVLVLGEAGLVTPLLSPQVLAEAEGALRRKASQALPMLAILLERAAVEVAEKAPRSAVSRVASAARHPGDAQVVADAVHAKADYLVTLDRTHLLGNQRLARLVPFPIGTPGDFIAWFRARVGTAE
jgi:putative PIN family toxin of toxin-antitoxin system